MNKKIEKIIQSRTFIIVLILFFICMSLLLGTYAWFTWNSTENTSLTMTIGQVADVTFTDGNDINTGLTPVYNYYDGVSTSFSVINKGTSDETLDYSIKLNITSIDEPLISEDVMYAIVKNDTLVTTGNLSTASNGSSIAMYTTSLDAGTTNYIIYFYIDGNVENDLSIMNSKITGNIMVEKGTILTTFISNLYTNASKTTVTNNGITYNYATSVSLMNDRLGNSTTGINDGNIRYYGASVDNYVDIGDHYEESVAKGNWDDYGFAGMFTTSEECYTYVENDFIEALISAGECTDYESCEPVLLLILADRGASSVADVCETTTIPKGTPKLYRIIGLFKDVELADGSKKDLVKVVRDKPIGNYSWDQSVSTVNSGWGVNEWSQADLMKLLNPGYESETVGGSLYWNSVAGSCYGYDITNGNYTSITCDFTNEGLSTSAQNNIVAVKWNLGGWKNKSVFANDMYSFERLGNVIQGSSDGITRSTVWPGRVALAYPSDYGYATDLSSCSDNLGNYNNCTSTNWMYSSLTINGMSNSWLLTPDSSSATYAWIVSSDGYVFCGDIVHNYHLVSPVFYLDSELIIGTGRGTSEEPYVLW